MISASSAQSSACSFSTSHTFELLTFENLRTRVSRVPNHLLPLVGARDDLTLHELINLSIGAKPSLFHASILP